MVTKRIRLQNAEEAVELLGEQDILLRQMEREFGVEMFLRQDANSQELNLSLRGATTRVKRALASVRQKLERLRQGRRVPSEAPLPSGTIDLGSAPLPPDGLYRSAFGDVVRPRTRNQSRYVAAIENSELAFGIGPAGTGKTFLAVACALRSLQAREVQRIVLTRPVVEAGERLGFLPGDLYEKVHPYLKPLFDAFYALLGPQRFRIWRDSDVIEIVPLAYMRGRTLENAFIILDEAQNSTPEQMKMFLTRMGNGSRIVVTGDITQTDLPSTSGLVRVLDILRHAEGVSFTHLKEEDVVRHPLVRTIVRAYDKWEKKKCASGSRA